MSLVTLTLTNNKFSPWGLLTEGEYPQPIIWLTEDNPTAQVLYDHLSKGDLIRIMQGVLSKMIVAEGLEIETPKPVIPQIPSFPTKERKSKVADKETTMQVLSQMAKEKGQYEELKKRLTHRSSEVEEILKLPAHKVRKRLKECAKGNYTVQFFQSCRRVEEEDKDRKTILALLVDLIQAKIAAVHVDRVGTQTGQSALSSAYYDMIEEFEDEDEEE